MTSGAGALSTLFTATAMLIFVGSCLVLLLLHHLRAGALGADCDCHSHFFWGPLFIPWLLFEPLSFSVLGLVSDP